VSRKRQRPDVRALTGHLTESIKGRGRALSCSPNMLPYMLCSSPAQFENTGSWAEFAEAVGGDEGGHQCDKVYRARRDAAAEKGERCMAYATAMSRLKHAMAPPRRLGRAGRGLFEVVFR
jgi:hypothetical protein